MSATSGGSSSHEISFEQHVLPSIYSFMQPPFSLQHSVPLFDSVLAARRSIVHQTTYIARIFSRFYNLASTRARQNLRENLERLKVFEGRLSVKLMNLTGVTCSAMGDDDPAIYCVLKTNSDKRTSKCVEHTTSPNFDQDFEVGISMPTTSFTVEVYHKSQDSSSIIGQIQIPLQNLEDSLPVTLTEALKPGPDRRSVTGSISLRLRYAYPHDMMPVLKPFHPHVFLIGHGDMGSMIASDLIHTKSFVPGFFTVCVRLVERQQQLLKVPGVRLTDDLLQAADADLILIAVRSNEFTQVLSALHGHIKPTCMVVSVVSGQVEARCRNALKVKACLQLNPGHVHRLPSLCTGGGGGRCSGGLKRVVPGDDWDMQAALVACDSLCITSHIVDKLAVCAAAFGLEDSDCGVVARVALFTASQWTKLAEQPALPRCLTDVVASMGEADSAARKLIEDAEHAAAHAHAAAAAAVKDSKTAAPAGDDMRGTWQRWISSDAASSAAAFNEELSMLREEFRRICVHRWKLLRVAAAAIDEQ